MKKIIIAVLLAVSMLACTPKEDILVPVQSMVIQNTEEIFRENTVKGIAEELIKYYSTTFVSDEAITWEVTSFKDNIFSIRAKGGDVVVAIKGRQEEEFVKFDYVDFLVLSSKGGMNLAQIAQERIFKNVQENYEKEIKKLMGN